MDDDTPMSRLLEDPRVLSARERARLRDPETLADQAAVTEIAAPPFGEAERGRWVEERYRTLGLESVETDREGNVLARSPAGDGEPPLVVAAHLDTVFPAGTDVAVRRRGDVLRAPGISDDGRGLAVVLALARILREEGIRTRRPILWAATVGEEGPGDLRGVKHLFGPTGAGRNAWGFISLDGAGLDRIATRGLGSRRFRISMDGPGGHSWVDRGTPNPIHALGRAVAALVEVDLPHDPATALTVARWAGGTSINSIPENAWVEVDTRSESEAYLETLEAQVREIAGAALGAEGDAGPDPARPTLELTVERIGVRPSGATDPDHPLVQAARAATVAVGGSPQLAVSSTDANIPMAAGIPAVTFGGGGEAGGAHTLKEWYRNVRGPEGVERALLTVLACAGIAGG